MNEEYRIFSYTNDFEVIGRYHVELLFDILQNRIRDLVKFGFGREYRLPVHVCCYNPEGINEFVLEKDMGKEIFKNKNDYLIPHYFSIYRNNIYSLHQKEENMILLFIEILYDSMGLYYFCFGKLNLKNWKR